MLLNGKSPVTVLGLSQFQLRVMWKPRYMENAFRVYRIIRESAAILAPRYMETAFREYRIIGGPVAISFRVICKPRSGSTAL